MPVTTHSAAGKMTAPPRTAAWFMQTSVLLRLCFVLLGAVYVRTIGFDFVYDDLTIVLGSGSGWRGLFSGFSHGLFQTAQGAGSSYYRPLSVFYIGAIQLATGGAPAWFHIAGIVIHLTVFYLAFRLGRYLFTDERAALLAALLFALHPIKTEPVAWIGSSGCDGLGALFFFATLLCYLRWTESRGGGWIAASVVLYAAALFTKETMAVLPALVGLHFWLTQPAKRKTVEFLKLVAPYAVAFAVFAWLRHAALAPTTHFSTAASTTYLRPTFSVANLWSAPLAFWWYIKHLVFPAGLSVAYDSLIVDRPTLLNFGLPLLGLAAVGTLAWQGWRKSSTAYRFLLVWFLLTLGPYIALAPMVQQHDRYLYLASYSFCAGLACLLLKVPQQRTRVILVGTIIAIFALISFHEIGFWDNNLSLWQRAEKIAPNLIEPRVMLGDLYEQNGDHAAAVKSVNDGLALHSTSPSLWQAKGILLLKTIEAGAAKDAFTKAYEFDRTDRVRPTAAFQLGKIALSNEDYAGAEQWLRTAIQLSPHAIGYHDALATALYGQGKIADARQQEKLEFQLARQLSARR